MPRYLLVRSFQVGEAEMPAVGRRSRRIIEEQHPEITWEHSHVVVDEEGGVRTFCVYAAPDEHAVRTHAAKLGEHTLDALHEIAGDVTPDDFPPI
ncbi:MAG TPA: nickel-binding protein [Gaiellaceae bacterium]|nr:nickel-binding protein [Gaiellaceae bacterium]